MLGYHSFDETLYLLVYSTLKVRVIVWWKKFCCYRYFNYLEDFGRCRSTRMATTSQINGRSSCGDCPCANSCGEARTHPTSAKYSPGPQQNLNGFEQLRHIASPLCPAHLLTASDTCRRNWHLSSLFFFFKPSQTSHFINAIQDEFHTAFIISPWGLGSSQR